MIAKKATEEIEKAISYELREIIANWGQTYHSTHEAFAILKEEVEEADEALDLLQNKLESIWQNIKLNWVTDTEVYQAKAAALALAEEAVQCAAVCEKFLETLKKK